MQNKKIAPRTLQDKLEELRHACHEIQSGKIEVLAEELKGVSLNIKVDGSLAEIHNLIMSFDYDLAIDKINKLLKFLKTMWGLNNPPNE